MKPEQASTGPAGSHKGSRRRFGFSILTLSQDPRGRLAAAGVLILILAAAAAAAFSGNAPIHEAAPTQSAALPVEVFKAREQSSYRWMRFYSGRVEARRTAELGFERSGMLKSVKVDEGAGVRQGQILAVLDSDILQAQRKEQAALLSSARARLDELLAGPRQETIDSASSRAEQFRQELALAKLQEQRAEKLLQRNAVSQEALDRARTDVRSMESRLKGAQRELDELLAGTRKEQIAAQRAEVSRIEASLSRIDVELEKSKLRASFAGRVSRRMVDEGTVVQQGQSILRLIEDGYLEARIGVSASTASRLQQLKGAHVIRAGDIPVEADLIAVGPDVDPSSRTVTAIFRLKTRDDGPVLPGQVARLQVEEETSERGFWVPVSSLSKGKRGLWSCYALAADGEGGFQVERRDVEVVHASSERVFVRGTLQDGDLLIKDGVHRVVPGQRVEPL